MNIEKIALSLLLLLISSTLWAGGKDDPLLTKVMINQLEYRNANGKNPLVLEGELWIGKDLNKFWIKADVERVGGKVEESEFQFLYSRAISAYWDVQVGYRRDFKPKPTRDWAAFGFKGVAPYFFEVDAAVFVGESGRTALRLEAEYEILFTQKLILTPEFDVDFYGQSDAATGVGSGLSQLSVGLRLRYEIKRQFGPYIGINWSRKYGGTADFVRAAGNDVSDTQFVVGLRAWF